MQSCDCYAALKVKLVEVKKQVEQYRVDVIHPSFVKLKGNIDSSVLDLRPDDAKKDLYPMKIYGDGHCLRRCGEACSSMRHIEAKVRIFIEGVSYESLYLKRYISCFQSIQH